MIDLQQLRGAIIADGFRSIGEAGKAIGIPESTMYLKMRNGNFTMDEVDDMVINFHIKHPEEIFKIGVR